MRSETANSNISNTISPRLHQFENGTRCRLPIGSSSFCPRHARLNQNQPIEEDLTAKLLKNSQDFQTAQGINFALGNLYDLVAQNRISTRRAAVPNRKLGPSRSWSNPAQPRNPHVRIYFCVKLQRLGKRLSVQ